MAATEPASHPGRDTQPIRIELPYVPDEEIGQIQPQATVSRAFAQEWAPALLLVFLDALLWIAIYSTVSAVRHEAFVATSFELVIITFFQLAVIIQALYIIGGYDWHTEM